LCLLRHKADYALQLSYSGMWATVIGFGRTLKTLAEDESSGNGSNTLMESSLQVISNSNCSEMYSESKETKISASMLCAYAAGTDTCQVILDFCVISFTNLHV
jgi:hypothetical protein